MRVREYSSRLEWARVLSRPACFICTGQFGFEPAIAIYAYSIDRDVYFHARCYDVVLKQAADAHSLFVRMVLGHVQWSTGSVQMEEMYPLRHFAPDKITIGDDLQ